MKHFTDREGRKWSIRINDAGLRRVQKLFKFDLEAMANAPGLWEFGEMFKDIEKVINVVHTLCHPRPDSLGMWPEDFGRAILDEKTLTDATFALGSAMTELCRDARVRCVLRGVVRDHRKAATIDG